MEHDSEEQNSALSPAPHQYSFYVQPLRMLFKSLWSDLSFGPYSKVPTTLRILCHTTRQLVYSLSQSTENLLEAVTHAFRLIDLIQGWHLDAELQSWHDLRLQKKIQAHLGRSGGAGLRVPEYSVEARIYILLGYLLCEGNRREMRAEKTRGLSVWQVLDGEYGDVGRMFYQVARAGT